MIRFLVLSGRSRRVLAALIIAVLSVLFLNDGLAQRANSYSVYDTGDTVFSFQNAAPQSNQLPAPQGCPTTNNITTPLNQNNAQRGIMFDVTALTNITISCFDVNMAVGTSPVQIYFKTGTHVGFQNNAAAWTLLGTANNVTGLGSNVLTPIPININVGVTAGCTVAFYITRTTTNGPTLYYTNGTAVGTVYSSNANIQVRDGTGKDYPFAASFQPRRFNGKIYYNVNPSSTSSITGPASICAGSTQQYTFVGTGWTGFTWTVPVGTVISSGQGTQTITITAGAVSGNICCTPSNACGPGAQICIPVTINPTPTITPSQINVTCNGSNNGSATANVTPSGVYTYAWSPSVSSSATASGLGSGVYSVTVTSTNGCTKTQTFNITQPPGITLTPTQTNVACFGGNTGSAAVTATGGTGVYTYAWAPTGGSNATATGLSAGTYTVTVSDGNACTATQSFSITQPPAITLTPTQTNVACFGGNTGSASVTATGGTGVYTYAWAPTGGSNAAATGLSAGTYTVTVSDGNACTATQSFSITQPPAITLTPTQTNVACFGGNTGSASVTATGGTGVYTYAWAPTGGSNAAATGLSAGTYTVTVSDGNACTATQSFSITQAAQLTSTTSFTQSTCGNANGSASVAIAGGTGPYSYTWAPSGGTSSTAINLTSGIYSVTVTDAFNCSTTATVNISNAGSPSVTIVTTTNVSCFGSANGSATSAVSGGTGPYSYSWSPSGGNNATASSLISGNYYVTVTDANNCSSTASVTITEPAALTATTNAIDALCFSSATGSVSATATGGTGPYSYLWSPSGGNQSNATNLTAGIYTVLITDANGCTSSSNATISEPPVLTSTISATDALCFGGNTGSAAVVVTGGIGNYTYTWTPSGGNNATANALLSGTYVVGIIDANGCTKYDSIFVNEPLPLNITIQSTDASCNQSDGTLLASASGGTSPYTYQWANPGGPSTSNWSNVSAGTYTVVVSDINGCIDTASQIVNTTNAVTATLSSAVNLSCFNANDGSVSIAVNGGSPVYTYAWTPNVSNTNTATGLSSGSYSVVVTDAAGCSASLSVVITQPPPLTLAAISTPGNICAGANVNLSANAIGGIPGYTFVWIPGNLVGIQQTVTPAVSTTYSVSVTDANGCTDTASVFVRVDPIPVVLFSSSAQSGCSPVCVNFIDNSTVTAPSVISTWDWDFGDGNISSAANPSHCYVTPGTYNVSLQLTSSDGCVATYTANNFIDVYALPFADFSSAPQQPTMINNTVSFIDQSTNAVQWNWSFGDILNSSSSAQNPQFTYLTPECFQVELEVISANGCTDTASEVVCIEPDVTIYVPNTFTPDGNGLNEMFLPSLIGIDPDKYEMRIFDRWGNEIFSSTQISVGWDGTVQGTGRICQEDTYVWTLKTTDLNGKLHVLRGIVNLIR